MRKRQKTKLLRLTFCQGDPECRPSTAQKDTKIKPRFRSDAGESRSGFRNEGVRPINASYVFPASTRAAVYAMRMRLGNK